MQAGVFHHCVIKAGAGGLRGALEERGQVGQGAEGATHRLPLSGRSAIGLILRGGKDGSSNSLSDGDAI
jgi:hypothetical protein